MGKNDPTSHLICDLSEEFLDGFIVQVAHFNCYLIDDDAHFVNYGHI